MRIMKLCVPMRPPLPTQDSDESYSDAAPAALKSPRVGSENTPYDTEQRSVTSSLRRPGSGPPVSFWMQGTQLMAAAPDGLRAAKPLRICNVNGIDLSLHIGLSDVPHMAAVLRGSVVYLLPTLEAAGSNSLARETDGLDFRLCEQASSLAKHLADPALYEQYFVQHTCNEAQRLQMRQAIVYAGLPAHQAASFVEHMVRQFAKGERSWGSTDVQAMARVFNCDNPVPILKLLERLTPDPTLFKAVLWDASWHHYGALFELLASPQLDYAWVQLVLAGRRHGGSESGIRMSKLNQTLASNANWQRVLPEFITYEKCFLHKSILRSDAAEEFFGNLSTHHSRTAAAADQREAIAKLVLPLLALPYNYSDILSFTSHRDFNFLHAALPSPDVSAATVAQFIEIFSAYEAQQLCYLIAWAQRISPLGAAVREVLKRDSKDLQALHTAIPVLVTAVDALSRWESDVHNATHHRDKLSGAEFILLDLYQNCHTPSEATAWVGRLREMNDFKEGAYVPLRRMVDNSLSSRTVENFQTALSAFRRAAKETGRPDALKMVADLYAIAVLSDNGQHFAASFVAMMAKANKREAVAILWGWTHFASWCYDHERSLSRAAIKPSQNWLKEPARLRLCDDRHAFSLVDFDLDLTTLLFSSKGRGNPSTALDRQPAAQLGLLMGLLCAPPEMRAYIPHLNVPEGLRFRIAAEVTREVKRAVAAGKLTSTVTTKAIKELYRIDLYERLLKPAQPASHRYWEEVEESYEFPLVDYRATVRAAIAPAIADNDDAIHFLNTLAQRLVRLGDSPLAATLKQMMVTFADPSYEANYAQRRLELQQALRQLPNMKLEAEAVAAAGYQLQTLAQEYRIGIAAGQATQTSPAFALMQLYDEYRDLLDIYGVTTIEDNGQSLAAAQFMALEEPTLAELERRKDILVPILKVAADPDTRGGTARAEKLERRLESINQRAEPVLERAKQPVPVLAQDFQVTVGLAADFIATVTSCPNSIPGCYAPNGFHAEKPLENALSVVSNFILMKDAKGFLIENAEVRLTQEALYIDPPHAAPHGVETDVLWLAYAQRLLVDKAVPQVVFAARGLRGEMADRLQASLVAAREPLGEQVLTALNRMWPQSYYDTDAKITPKALVLKPNDIGILQPHLEGQFVIWEPPRQATAERMTRAPVTAAEQTRRMILASMNDNPALRNLRFLARQIGDYVSTVAKGDDPASVLSDMATAFAPNQRSEVAGRLAALQHLMDACIGAGSAVSPLSVP